MRRQQVNCKCEVPGSKVVPYRLFDKEELSLRLEYCLASSRDIRHRNELE